MEHDWRDDCTHGLCSTNLTPASCLAAHAQYGARGALCGCPAAAAVWTGPFLTRTHLANMHCMLDNTDSDQFHNHRTCLICVFSAALWASASFHPQLLTLQNLLEPIRKMGLWEKSQNCLHPHIYQTVQALLIRADSFRDISALINLNNLNPIEK